MMGNGLRLMIWNFSTHSNVGMLNRTQFMWTIQLMWISTVSWSNLRQSTIKAHRSTCFFFKLNYYWTFVGIQMLVDFFSSSTNSNFISSWCSRYQTLEQTNVKLVFQLSWIKPVKVFCALNSTNINFMLTLVLAKHKIELCWTSTFWKVDFEIKQMSTVKLTKFQSCLNKLINSSI